MHYPFPSQFQPLNINDKLIIFPVKKQIALHKAYTIGRRGAYHDYFDLYSMLKRQIITVEEIISSDEVIYNGAFDKKLFLEQLAYFDDLKNFEILPVTDKKIPSSR